VVTPVCPLCGAAFSREPSHVQPTSYCSNACRSDACDDLAGFDPGPATTETEVWIDGWRRARVGVELARAQGRA
jgi:hypothetical protein